MNDANAFLVAGHVAATACVNQERSAKSFGLAGSIRGRDGDTFTFIGELVDGPTFTHFRATTFGVLKEKVVKFGALDLNGFVFAGIAALAEHKFGASCAIAE